MPYFPPPPKPNPSRQFIPLPFNPQTPLLEYHTTLRRWVIWLNYNNDRTEGTYIELHARPPRAERCTLLPTGIVTRIVL